MPVATKVLGEVIAGKSEKRNAFTETVLLTEIMRQQSDSPSARQFGQASEIRDPPFSRKICGVLLARTSESLAVKVHMEFNDVLHLYATRKRTAGIEHTSPRATTETLVNIQGR